MKVENYYIRVSKHSFEGETKVRVDGEYYEHWITEG